jgi:very-short-patch-repair endonuclease
MTDGAGSVADWWTLPPTGQVSYLAGADPELLAITLDPLPAAAPAVVQFRPAAGAALGDPVQVLLDELDRAALALFPGWLPGGERLAGPQGLGVPAVRALAARSAARSRDFGPFLADLAERGLRHRAGEPLRHHPAGRWRFPAEVRAAGLVRVIALAYGRTSAAMLVAVPEGLSGPDEATLVAAAEWLAYHGRLSVWLAGAALRAVDRVRSVAVRPPVDADAAPPHVGAGTAPRDPRPVFSYPPVSGVPRADSAAEQALERALARHEWAKGRRWNHTYDWHLLGKPYRLDLFWASERLVVEVDGPDHRGRLKYADDRIRDTRLQVHGHHVLRFTNEQVLADVEGVVAQIRQLLCRRRAEQPHHTEMGHHVEQ